MKQTTNHIRIQFLGAAGTVTGSKYLVEAFGKSVLIDCGLFQGAKRLREMNWQPLPIDISSIDAVLLTHGHLDHCGYLPRLVKNGFKAEIIATQPTIDITEIILKDSAEIQEEEAERANRGGYTKHVPALPLYTVKDVERTYKYFQKADTDDWYKLSNEFSFRFRTNGHIIGATFIEMDLGDKRVVFSGDIGRVSDLLMPTPKYPDSADVLVIESTYGDRLHPKEDEMPKLKSIIRETYANGGTLIIPSFAVERAQILMYLLWQLSAAKEIPDIPMIMDSPMTSEILTVFRRYSTWHKLSPQECDAMCSRFSIVKHYEETKDWIDDSRPKIVIAGSGMITGGRVLSYLQRYISKPETTVLLPGFQAEGTRGRQLKEGATEIKIFGKNYPVKARIEIMSSLSGHGDQQELLQWMGALKSAPKKIFITHGERQASDTFRIKIKDTYGWDAECPELFENVLIK